jgi:hypothetical protein
MLRVALALAAAIPLAACEHLDRKATAPVRTSVVAS